jgi:hypothetical protein
MEDANMMINLFSKALVVLVVFVVIMAILFGATVGNAEFLSPHRTAAEVEIQRISAAHQARMNELTYQKQAARTEQEVQHILNEIQKQDARTRAEIDAIARRTALVTEFIANLQYLLLFLLGLAGSALIFTTAFLVARLALARLPAGPPEAPPPTPPPARTPDPWADPLYRRRRRIEAQVHEAVARYTTHANGRQAPQKDPAGKNGSAKDGGAKKSNGYKDLPLAM